MTARTHRVGGMTCPFSRKRLTIKAMRKGRVTQKAGLKVFLLVPLFFLLSSAAISPVLHDLAHDNDGRSEEHTCILTLIEDGKLASPVATVTISNWVPFPAVPVTRLHEAPTLGPFLYLVSWALAPPVIV